MDIALLQSLGLPNIVTPFFSMHPYGIIFLFLLLGGGVILFPAFYIATVGALTWWYIVGIMILAGIFADTFWYLVGRGALPKFLASRFESQHYLKKLSKHTEGKELILLFYSKFIYGTRIATQVLCGARHVNFISYLLVNSGAVLMLGIFYYGIVRFTASSVASLGEVKHKIVIILSVTMLGVGLLHILLNRLLRKRMGM